MSCSLISAPPTLNDMTVSYAIQPINTSVENAYRKSIEFIYILLLYSL